MACVEQSQSGGSRPKSPEKNLDKAEPCHRNTQLRNKSEESNPQQGRRNLREQRRDEKVQKEGIVALRQRLGE
jgi:hypothetical protein